MDDETIRSYASVTLRDLDRAEMDLLARQAAEHDAYKFPADAVRSIERRRRKILAEKIEAERAATPAPTPGWKRSLGHARSTDDERHPIVEIPAMSGNGNSNGNGTGGSAVQRTNYRGVTTGGSASAPWRAQISEGGKVRTIGYYADPADGARAYDAECRRLGRVSKLNFPDESGPPPPSVHTPRPRRTAAPAADPTPAPSPVPPAPALPKAHTSPLLREIEALGQVARILDALDPAVAGRIVRYVASAYPYPETHP